MTSPSKPFTKTTAAALLIGTILSLIGIVGNAYVLIETIQSGLTIVETVVGVTGGVTAFLVIIFGMQWATQALESKLSPSPHR